MAEVLTNKTLLDNRGRLMAPGFSRHMIFALEKSSVHSAKLREWDFYQIHFDGRYVLQLVLGHASCAMQATATLIDLATGDTHSAGKFGTVHTSFRRAMPTNPEVANTVQYFAHNLLVQFETTDKFRRLAFTASDYSGIKAEIYLMLTNVSRAKEKMVVSTSFDNPRFWNLGYKESGFVVNGYVRMNDVAYRINNGFGLLDWGRGVWPASNRRVWGGGGTTVNDKSFAFNIGWGFGNTLGGTENAFFYDNKLFKLGEVQEIRLGDGYRYIDEDERFVFRVEPICSNVCQANIARAGVGRQIFGRWSGYVVTDSGEKLQIPPFLGFCEHANKYN